MTLAGLRETAIAWTRISYEKPIRTRGTRTRLDARRLRHCRFGGGCRCLLRLTLNFLSYENHPNEIRVHQPIYGPMARAIQPRRIGRVV